MLIIDISCLFFFVSLLLKLGKLPERTTLSINRGTAYRGDGLGHHAVVQGTAQCNELCKQIINCAFWTLRNGDGNQVCAFKGSNSSPEPSDDHVSGIMNCKSNKVVEDF